VVLAGARRPAGADLGHVDLLHRLEAAGGVGGEQARQAGREAGADDHVEPTLDGLGVEFQQGAHVVDVVGDRDHRCAGVEGHLGPFPVTPRTGEQHDVGAGRAGDRPGRVAQGLDHGIEARLTGLGDTDTVDLTQEKQLARGAHAHRSGPHHHGVHELLQFRAAELAPPALLEGHGAATLEPHAGGGDAGEHEGQGGPAYGLHRGASWNRTSDLTLIRGAL
jgi:hypothetical protein